MMNMNPGRAARCGMLSVLVFLAGCGGATDTGGNVETSTVQQTSPPPADDAGDSSTGSNLAAEPAPEFAPVVLGGPPTVVPDGAEPNSPTAVVQRQELLAAMMPLQVMLGNWRGITQRQVGDFNGVDEPNWVWDFQSDRNQPVMVMTSEGSPYFREMRLTYLTDDETFHMTSSGPEDETRTFEGHFSEEPAEVQGEDRKTHLTYKLTLTQLDTDNTDEQWQVVFNQQENNRYLLELYRKRGASFRRVDTVSTQREGTSIAANDEDYGERKCVISGGLGTMQVSHEGRTFWVCCSGCKAAFEEDPESWIAEYDEAAE